ncbi:MAG: GNAT family acetyltransferase [Candidatus Methylacidiphilales bacterium]
MSEADVKPIERIRSFKQEDREAVRSICCDTGFLGRPVDEVFEDRELFADFLTSYYTDAEPESAVVLESDGRVVGYVLGSRFPKRQKSYERRRIPGRLLKMFWRMLTRYGASTRRYVFWLLWRGWREVPMTPKGMAHFHINLLPEFKSVQRTRELIDFFLDYLTREGEPSVYGQMVTYGSRRGERMFARYGFEVVDSVEVTKFRAYSDASVFLFTVVKDLKKSARLYGDKTLEEGS